MSPIGIYGSALHVLTNKKVADKKACYKEQIKTSLKDSFKATTAVAGTAGAAAGAVTLINKFNPSALGGMKSVYNSAANLAKSFCEDKGFTALESLVKSFGKIPMVGKVALAAGALSALIIAPIHYANQVAKMGSIEGKHEVK